MIKSELITKITARVNYISEADLNESVNLILERLCMSLSQSERIEIRGFGSFSLHYRPPRNAHNPKSGARLLTQAKYSPHFKPGKEMRERINESAASTTIKDSLIEDDSD